MSTPPRATASDHVAALPRQQRRSVDIIGGAAAIGDAACAWHHGTPRIHHRNADSWRAHGCMTLPQVHAPARSPFTFPPRAPFLRRRLRTPVPVVLAV